MNTMYIYLAERQGLLNTRESKLNKLIDLLSKSKNPNKDLYVIAPRLGFKSLSVLELKRINQELKRRRK